MINTLCFGDSNTWGYIPVTAERHPIHARWTGVLQSTLGPAYRVIEEGLNGRTTAHDEPGRLGRNGLAVLPLLLKTHTPDCVIIMLGTNDLKPLFRRTAEQIAHDAGRLCEAVQRSPHVSPKIVLVSPAHVNDLQPHNAAEFAGAKETSHEFAVHYEAIANRLGVTFFDAAQVVHTHTEDGVHWDATQHGVFGRAMAGIMSSLFIE